MTHRLLLALVVLGLAACGPEPIRVGPRPRPRAPAGDGQDAGVDAGRPRPTYDDDDFVDAENNRDPFRPYPEVLVGVVVDDPGVSDRVVIMNDVPIDEMRVIGVVTGVADPRAMIVDPSGRGHTVRRGTYLGRSEAVQAGGTDAIQVSVNWRVDRIIPNGVALARDDPNAPDRPPVTRVLALRQDGDAP